MNQFYKGDKSNKEYTIINQIGKGSGGVVYKALENQTKKYVALKFQNYMSENEKLAISNLIQVKFNHILNIYDFWFEYPYYRIIMELGDDSFYNYLFSNRVKFTTDNINYLFYQIVYGVNELHERQLMHRDLKPENIIYQQQANGDIILKLIDTGLMKDSKFKIQTIGVGTVFYMAPEQINSSEYNEKVDIWALGMIWYEMLNKNVAMVKGISIEQILNQISKSNQEWFHTQIQNLNNCDQEIKDIMKQMLIYDKNNRKISCKDILNFLSNKYRPRQVIPLFNQINNNVNKNYQQQKFQEAQNQQLNNKEVELQYQEHIQNQKEIFAKEYQEKLEQEKQQIEQQGKEENNQKLLELRFQLSQLYKVKQDQIQKEYDQKLKKQQEQYEQKQQENMIENKKQKINFTKQQLIILIKQLQFVQQNLKDVQGKIQQINSQNNEIKYLQEIIEDQLNICNMEINNSQIQMNKINESQENEINQIFENTQIKVNTLNDQFNKQLEFINGKINQFKQNEQLENEKLFSEQIQQNINSLLLQLEDKIIQLKKHLQYCKEQEITNSLIQFEQKIQKKKQFKLELQIEIQNIKLSYDEQQIKIYQTNNQKLQNIQQQIQSMFEEFIIIQNNYQQYKSTLIQNTQDQFSLILKQINELRNKYNFEEQQQSFYNSDLDKLEKQCIQIQNQLQDNLFDYNITIYQDMIFELKQNLTQIQTKFIEAQQLIEQKIVKNQNKVKEKQEVQQKFQQFQNDIKQQIMVIQQQIDQQIEEAQQFNQQIDILYKGQQSSNIKQFLTISQKIEELQKYKNLLNELIINSQNKKIEDTQKLTEQIEYIESNFNQIKNNINDNKTIIQNYIIFFNQKIDQKLHTYQTELLLNLQQLKITFQQKYNQYQELIQLKSQIIKFNDNEENKFLKTYEKIKLQCQNQLNESKKNIELGQKLKKKQYIKDKVEQLYQIIIIGHNNLQKQEQYLQSMDNYTIAQQFNDFQNNAKYKIINLNNIIENFQNLEVEISYIINNKNNYENSMQILSKIKQIEKYLNLLLELDLQSQLQDFNQLLIDYQKNNIQILKLKIIIIFCLGIDIQYQIDRLIKSIINRKINLKNPCLEMLNKQKVNLNNEEQEYQEILIENNKIQNKYKYYKNNLKQNEITQAYLDNINFDNDFNWINSKYEKLKNKIVVLNQIKNKSFYNEKIQSNTLLTKDPYCQYSFIQIQEQLSIFDKICQK